MNTDAAQVLAVLQSDGRSDVDYINLRTAIPHNRINGALVLLEAVGKVKCVDADIWEVA